MLIELSKKGGGEKLPVTILLYYQVAAMKKLLNRIRDCVTDLDKRIEIITFKSILTTFE